MRWLTVVLLVGCAEEEPAERKDKSTDSPPMIEEVCINELLAKTDLDPEGDWLELSGRQGLLDGWSLLWSRDDVERYELDGLSILSSGFAVLYTEDLPFGLDADGDSVGLEAPDGSQEWIEFGPLPSEHTLARTTDCCREPDCWELVFGLGTPGESNTAAQ